MKKEGNRKINIIKTHENQWAPPFGLTVLVVLATLYQTNETYDDGYTVKGS